MKTKHSVSPEKIENVDRILDSELSKVLSEPIRLKIIRFLVLNGACDVGTISAEFPQDRSVISRHLKMMSQAGLLLVEKKSRFVVYSFDGETFLKMMENQVKMVRNLVRPCLLSCKKKK